jgi:hypothetical protein
LFCTECETDQVIKDVYVFFADVRLRRPEHPLFLEKMDNATLQKHRYFCIKVNVAKACLEKALQLSQRVPYPRPYNKTYCLPETLFYLYVADLIQKQFEEGRRFINLTCPVGSPDVSIFWKTVPENFPDTSFPEKIEMLQIAPCYWSNVFCRQDSY